MKKGFFITINKITATSYNVERAFRSSGNIIGCQVIVIYNLKILRGFFQRKFIEKDLRCNSIIFLSYIRGRL